MKALYGALVVLLHGLTAAAPSYAQTAVSPSAALTSPAADVPQGDSRRGASEFSACVNCHGGKAEGGFGPDLAGRDIGWLTFKKAVREPWASVCI
jgi:mono/diheme cytochrome c family protein